MYNPDFVLKNLQWSIFYKTKPNLFTSWRRYFFFFFLFSFFSCWFQFQFLFQILSVDLKSNRIFLTSKKSLVESTLPIVFRFDQIKEKMFLEGYVKFLNDLGIQLAFYGDLTVSFLFFISYVCMMCVCV